MDVGVLAWDELADGCRLEMTVLSLGRRHGGWESENGYGSVLCSAF